MADEDALLTKYLRESGTVWLADREAVGAGWV